MGEEKSLIRLHDEDWDTLLPGEEYTLGQTKFKVVPLGLKDTSALLKRLAELGTIWGPILDEYASGKLKNKQPKELIMEVLPKIAEMLASQAVDVLSLMSGVAQEDIERLPLLAATNLGIFCIEVNIKSQQGLEKNFKTLADLVTRLTQGKSLLGV